MILVVPGKVRLPHHYNAELDRTIQIIRRRSIVDTVVVQWCTGYVRLLGFGGMCVLRGDYR